MKSILKYLFLAVSVSLAACSSYDLEGTPMDVQNAIYSTWVDTVAMQPKGYSITQLEFNPNGFFVLATRTYGVYTNQSTNDLSGYTEYYGNYVLSARNLYFISKQTVTWDSFTLAVNPTTTVKDQVLYESCTYIIKNDSLTLTYITYPADAPVTTQQKFKKIK